VPVQPIKDAAGVAVGPIGRATVTITVGGALERKEGGGLVRHVTDHDIHTQACKA
jgi:hypothetical protein